MLGADMLKAALQRPDLTPKLRAFLQDVQRQAARRQLSARQIAAVERIARAEAPPAFATISLHALARGEAA